MRLTDYLTKEEITTSEFARRIGVDQMSVGRYRRGERIPRPDIMQKITVATGGRVGPADFYSDVRG